MKVKKLILRNFRIFKDETIIKFDDLTAFIGKNDIGKSTILDALDIFFNGKEAQSGLDKEDISRGSDSNDIYISIVFKDFPQEIPITSNVRVNLRKYFLLNKDNFLEICKIFPDGSLNKVKTFIVANFPSDEIIKDIWSLSSSKLRKTAMDLGIHLEDQLSDIEIIRNILYYFTGKQNIYLYEKLIPLDKGRARLIFEGIKRYFPIYTLFKADRRNVDQDVEIQNPMKIAIKRALKRDEIQEKLKEVKEKIEEEVRQIANDTIDKLRDMNPEIAQQLSPKIPEPKWEGAFKGITISSDEDIPLNKRGSGVRRLILLSFLRAEAEKKKEEKNAPHIIYAFEEPEISQHPDHQKKLINALVKLSQKDDVQIILTTHSPGIAGLLSTESLRFLHKDINGRVIVEEGSNDEILDKIAESLGVLPTIDQDSINHLKLIVCVEGPNDIEFFKRLGRIVHDKLKIDFENDKRVIILPLGGSTLKHWVDNHYLRKLGKPEIHIYDGDKNKGKYKTEFVKISNRGDGSRVFITRKREIENYVHPKVIKDIFRLNDEELLSLIDLTNPDWIKKWDTMDIPKEIMSIYSKKGWSIQENNVKEKICTKGIENMSIEFFEELEAYDEIEEWFEAMKGIIEH